MNVRYLDFLVTPNAQKWMLKSLLLHAIQRDDFTEVVNLLHNGADVDSLIYSGQKEKPVLCVCIETRHFDMAKLFIQHGCSLSLSNGSGMTPLHLAVVYSEANFVQYLLENRANVNVKDNMDQTPLHLACSVGSYDMVAAFVGAGSHLNVRDMDGRTPLILACMRNQVLIASYLLQKGAAVNYSDRHGNTALSYVVSRRPFPGLVDLLLQMGAEINFINNVGDNPLMCFVHGQVADPCENEDDAIQVLKLLYEAGCGINEVNSREQNVLHLAVCSKQLCLVQKILNYGCKIGAIDSLGKTPLFYACRGGCAASVSLLVAAGIQWDQEQWLRSETLKASCDQELVNLCVQESKSVRKLTELCRSVVRAKLAPNIESTVKVLECAPKIKRYITFNYH